MTEVISVVNQKGGVGKTTTTVNLATALAVVGYKTLLIDIDPQGNASTGLGIDYEKRSSIYDILAENISLKNAINETIIPNLHIITSTINLAALEAELANEDGKEFCLKNIVSKLSSDYDFVLIDCPPSLGLLTINALVASKNILIPLQCEFYAMEGLTQLIKTYELVKKAINPQLTIAGIILTMIQRRNNLSKYVEEEVRKMFGDKVYEIAIPRNVKLSEAPSYGKPALIYDAKCSGSIAYVKLAKELLKQFKIKVENAA